MKNVFGRLPGFGLDRKSDNRNLKKVENTFSFQVKGQIGKQTRKNSIRCNQSFLVSIFYRDFTFDLNPFRMKGSDSVVSGQNLNEKNKDIKECLKLPEIYCANTFHQRGRSIFIEIIV